MVISFDTDPLGRSWNTGTCTRRRTPRVDRHGICPIEKLPSLDDWTVLCRTKILKWEAVEGYGFVPQFELEIKKYRPDRCAAYMIPLPTEKFSVKDMIAMQVSEAK